MAYVRCPMCGKDEFNTETNCCDECGYDRGPSRMYKRFVKLKLIVIKLK